MNDLQEIEKLWNEFGKISFPEDIEDIDERMNLISLDSFAAGCIDTFIDNKGSLDKKRQNILESCRNDLQIVISDLKDETKVYFEKLLVLADKIIRIKK